MSTVLLNGRSFAPWRQPAFYYPTVILTTDATCLSGASEDPTEGRLLTELLAIEKHEDRMITAMVKLTASSEKLNRRLAGLTWVMLTLTWVTFIIAIPNTLATIFGIPKVSQILALETMVVMLVASTAGAFLLAVLPNSALSLRNLERKLQSD
jgi:hypothetical protein